MQLFLSYYAFIMVILIIMLIIGIIRNIIITFGPIVAKLDHHTHQ